MNREPGLAMDVRVARGEWCAAIVPQIWVAAGSSEAAGVRAAAAEVPQASRPTRHAAAYPHATRSRLDAFGAGAVPRACPRRATPSANAERHCDASLSIVFDPRDWSHGGVYVNDAVTQRRIVVYLRTEVLQSGGSNWGRRIP